MSGVIDPVALSELSNAAHIDGHVDAHARLENVQRWLREDLAEVEASLDRAVSTWPSPTDAAARHLTAAGGKRVRPAAALLSARAIGNAGRSEARTVALTAELVHSATLLHDDVMDEGDLRRGVPTARTVHGNLVSVLAGDFLLVSALRAGSELGHPRVFTDLVNTLEALVRGEVLQVKGKRELIIDRNHHLEVMRCKTASLFGWCCRAGARVAGGSELLATALGEFGERIGVAFQLLDDVLDVVGEHEKTGKGAWSDLREGKATWPVIVAVEAGAVSTSTVAAASQGDVDAVATLARAIEGCGAVAATRNRATEETTAAMEALSCVPASAARETLVTLACALVGRDH